MEMDAGRVEANPGWKIEWPGSVSRSSGSRGRNIRGRMHGGDSSGVLDGRKHSMGVRIIVQTKTHTHTHTPQVVVVSIIVIHSS